MKLTKVIINNFRSFGEEQVIELTINQPDWEITVRGKQLYYRH